MHEENVWSNRPREDDRGKEERTPKKDKNDEEKSEKVKREEEKDENEMVAVKRKREGCVSVEASEICSQRRDLERNEDLS